MSMNQELEAVPMRAEASPFTFKLLDRQRDSLRRIAATTGTALSEQIRRGIDLWIAQQEQGR